MEAVVDFRPLSHLHGPLEAQATVMGRRDVSRLASNLCSIHGLSPVCHVVESALSPSAARQVNQVTCSPRLPSMHGCFVGRGALSRTGCALTIQTPPPQPPGRVILSFC
jgi:hypothetical protein